MQLKLTRTTLNVTAKLESLPRSTVTIQANPTLEEVRVNMAEMKAESKPVELVTSVGSCIAVCLHDPVNMCGGLAHVMLPKSSIAPHEPLPAKYADTAVPALSKAIRELGKRPTHLTAKIAGGANMFPGMNALNIGQKNILAVKEALESQRIRLLAEDLGGNAGRRITFDVTTGNATVKRFNGAVTKL
jgi:chemotaxis protein CheD